MSISLDFNACLRPIAGDHGLELADLEALAPRAKEIHASLQQRRRDGELGFFELPFDRAEAEKIRAYAEGKKGEIDAVVHLGIGGSGLGPICVHQALRHPAWNEDAGLRDGWPRLYVVDNADPEMIASVCDRIDPARTLLHVVSKSGTTPETMTGFMVFWDVMVGKLGAEEAAKRTVFTTDPENGVLRALANRDGIATFNIPPNVGGRFSVLTSVGLLPAALTGLDPVAILDGAADMARRCDTDDLLANPAYLNAAIHWLMDTTKGKPISVMMPYSQALRAFAWWYGQLWAESLGKRHDRAGKEVLVGQTPVAALGATDQHSQVQLYTEGPNDKIFTLLEVADFRRDCPIPAAADGLEAMAHFGGHDMAHLLNMEKQATEFALSASGRPSITWKLSTVDEGAIGALFYLYELSTAFAGDLYDINAFDQPGVEEGKKATHALMGRGGDADRAKLAEVEAWRARFTQKAV